MMVDQDSKRKSFYYKKNIEGGSPAFMTPEILLLELRPIETSMKDLKLLDILVFGMIMFVLLNPSVTHPNR